MKWWKTFIEQEIHINGNFINGTKTDYWKEKSKEKVEENRFLNPKN